MQNKSRMDKNGETMADRALKKYIEWISEEFYNEFGLGKHDTNLQTIEAKKLAWQTLHPWNEDKEKFIINQTKLYIRLLDSHDSNSTNLQFIKALVNRIALYLSEYCQNGPNRSKNRAQKILKDALYENNSYIRGLELYQAERRQNAQPRTPKTIADRKKREHIAAQQKKRDMERQAQIMLVEAAAYRKK